MLYWNVQKSKLAMIEAVDAGREYDIIAIQEPWQNPHVATTYCPRGGRYHLVYAGEGSRSAIMIHKKLPLVDWTATATKDWCRAQIRTAVGEITIYSVYSPIPGRDLSQWSSPIHQLATQDPPHYTLLVGDFNLHHPNWDIFGRRTEGVGDLLALSASWDLQLHTPYGEPTRTKHGNRDSTIDHAWATRDLRIKYEGPEEYKLSDHKPQVVHIELETQGRQEPTPEGLSWHMMDKDRVAAEAAHLRCPTDVNTAEEIDRQLDLLIEELQRIAAVSTPRRKPNNGRANPWWNRKVKEAMLEAKSLERRWYNTRSQVAWEQFRAVLQRMQKAIAEAKRQSWRKAVQEASNNPQKVWALAKWARTRSHCSPEPPKIPPLKIDEESEPTAFTHNEKTDIFRKRFLPETEAVLDDIQERTFDNNTFGQTIEIDNQVTPEQVAGVINRARPWKAPGRDGIPMGFLKACGEPLHKVLASLAQASLKLEYFPRRFRDARVTVLRKPGKTTAQLQLAGGWRPIALLNTVGKVIEAIVAGRIADAAEVNNLLPANQMGNRRNRSSELAIRLLTDQIRTAWAYNAIPSLLQLDIKGAFDRVCHLRLLDTLRKKGFPPWLVRWIQSYLTNRTATLSFDGEESIPLHVHAGVPQGSPLSPILFILYIASLYEALEEVAKISVIGFADDTNIIAFGQTAQENCRTLERAWAVCEKWSESRGMEFAPGKSELIHFSRTRNPLTDRVQLGNTTKEPTTSTRFLGVWLDRKLTWKAHLKEVQQKLETQRLALTRLAAASWGFSLPRAREVYAKVIRSAMAYGATAFHKVTEPGGNAVGIAGSLRKEQTQCLRTVAGAYRATPVRALETETFVPPLDLYLNGRVAQFEGRIEESGMGQLIRDSCATIARKLRNRRRHYTMPQEHNNETTERVKRWLATDLVSADRKKIQTTLVREWKERWQREVDRSRARHRGRAEEPADEPPTKERLKLHDELQKAESSLLVQMRTGKIGLRAFLFERRVPDVMTPVCSCGDGRETARHVAAYCQLEETTRRELPFAMRTHRDFDMAVKDPTRAASLTRWLMRRQRVGGYRVALQIADSEEPVVTPPTRRHPR